MESVDIGKVPDSPVIVDAEDIQANDLVDSRSASGKLKDENLLEADDIDEAGPTSSAENIIPLDKLRNGWFAVSGFMMSTAQKVKASAVEAYNSESVNNIKQRTSEAVARTSEVVTPMWERTCEAAAPAWEKTCDAATYAVEKTQENAAIASVTITQSVQEKWKQFTAPTHDEAGVELNSEGVDTGSDGDNASPILAQPTYAEPPKAGPPTIV